MRQPDPDCNNYFRLPHFQTKMSAQVNSGTDCWFNAVLQILILLMSLVTNAQNPDGRAPQDPYAFIVYEKLNEFRHPGTHVMTLVSSPNRRPAPLKHII